MLFRYMYWKIPLYPSSLTMYLNLFYSVGEKKTPPTPLHLGVCTIRQLTDQSVTLLIDCYRLVGVNDPDRSRMQTPPYSPA